MKNEAAQKNEIDCAITVAHAAPAIPQWKTKINNTSKIVFVIAPISIVYIAKCGKLLARMKLFNVMFVIMKIEPSEMMLRYVLAYGMIVAVQF